MENGNQILNSIRWARRMAHILAWVALDTDLPTVCAMTVLRHLSQYDAAELCAAVMVESCSALDQYIGNEAQMRLDLDHVEVVATLAVTNTLVRLAVESEVDAALLQMAVASLV